MRVFVACKGTITGASSSASGEWWGCCDRCAQTFRMGPSTVGDHLAAIDVPEAIGALFVETDSRFANCERHDPGAR